MKKYLSVFFSGILVQAGFGQLTYEGCSNVVSRDNNFSFEQIVSLETDPSLDNPIKMDFLLRDDGQADVYFTQQTGEIKKFDAGTGAISQIGSVNSHWDTGKKEDGLIGIALSPTFKEDGFMYVYYSHTQDGYRISRLTVGSNGQVTSGSEVVMIKIPSTRNRWHTSGAMRFDDYGDLWITVGDNEQLRKSAANTADMRGGILRIHPEPDGSYTIPDGNLWEFAADYFAELGDNTTAEAYRDESKMKREIYAMGTRNAYSLTLDPVRRWAVVGDCGPDTESRNANTPQDKWTEEHTVVTEPGFLGWPYYTAINYYMPDVAYATEPYWGAGIPANAPTNTDGQSGSIEKLMPVTPGTYNYAHSCAMTGPIYRYDGASPSNRKLPPHFNNKWLVSDFSQNWIRAVSLSEDGSQIQGNPVTLFQNNPFYNIIDFQLGPDGALYTLQKSCGANWYITDDCSGIVRISYNGDCQDPNLLPARSGCKDANYAEYDADAEYDNPAACLTPASSIKYKRPEEMGIQFLKGVIKINHSVKMEVSFRTVNGKIISGQSVEGPTRINIPEYSGILIAEFKSDIGLSQKRVPGF